MKKLFIYFMFPIVFVSCNDTSGTKEDGKSDSTILAPETNSNMVDTRPLITDSSRIDSTRLKDDTPMAK